MPWWGWLALGVAIGVVAGAALMTLLIAAAREPVERAADIVVAEAETWLRQQGRP